MIRLNPEPGKPINPEALLSVEALIQARIDGRITRRALCQRAAKIGVAAPLIGIMLHATSDFVHGAPANGRNATLLRHQNGATVPVTGPTAPAGNRMPGGTIITGSSSEPDSLNPFLMQALAGWDITQGVIDGLLRYDSTQTLIPSLATGFSISDDGLSYTFDLRQGVTFHNGDPFTAQDVIATWEVVNNPEFSTYNVYAYDRITAINVSDDGTQLTLVTDEAFAPFISSIGDGPVSPAGEIAKGITSFQQEYGRKPIGTGPMQMVEWKAQEEIVVTRFDNYWGTPAILDGVIHRIVPDDSTQLVQLETGEIQLCGSAGAILALRAEEAMQIDGITLLEHPTQAWKHFDLKQIDHLRQTKVRQALDFATPKQAIVEQLLKSLVAPSSADQAPGTWAFNPDLIWRPYDPDMAKQLLEEAGLTMTDGVWTGPTPTPDKTIDPNVDLGGPVKPLEIELWATSGDSQNELVMQVVAQAWNDIGIKTVTKYEDIATIWGPEGYQFTEKMTGGVFAWYNSNDPDNMWYWHSKWIPTDPLASGGNLPAFFFPYSFQAKIDDLTERAAADTNQENRAALYREVQVLLAEEVPALFLYWDKAFPAVANNIGGFWPSAFTNLMWNVQDWYLTEL